MANTNFFVVKNGLAVGNTTSTKHVINNAGQWIGDPTGVIQNSYDQANVAIVIATSGYDQANLAFNKANSSNVLAQAAFDKANTDANLAQFAYNEANLASSIATSAGVYANTGITIGQAAFDAANNVSLQVQPAFDTANAAYNQANTGTLLAQSAFDKANTPSTNSFSTISVTGVVDEITANTPSDVLTFTGDSGIYLSVDKPNNTIGIATLGGIQGITIDWGYVYEPVTSVIDFGTL